MHDIRLPDEFSQQIIKWFEMDRSGMLWLVTGNGLYRYDGGEAIHLGADSYPKLPHAAINTVFADAHNNLWIGAKDGLTRLNLKTWSTKEIKVL